jgi:hypothetical protein
VRHANGNIPIRRGLLPEDPLQATDTTVSTMMQLAEGPYGMRSPKIRALAINIVRSAGVKEKDYYGEILAVHEWVKKNIRYMRDPVNQETLSHPEELAFNSKAGDCDDMTVLEIALLGSIGIKAWPVVVGVSPGMPSHVYLRAKVPEGRGRMAGKVINLDPIMKEWRAGQEAPKHKVKIAHDYRDGNYMQGIQKSHGGSMNGLDDLGDAFSMLPGMGSYVVSDSYLDTEHSQAELLLKPDLSKTTGSVINAPQVSVQFEGIDGMLGGTRTEVVGDDTPMYARDSLQQLGPKGPMTALAARRNTHALEAQRPVPIGAKVYEVPTMNAALNRSRGKAPTVATGNQRPIYTLPSAASNLAKVPKTPAEEGIEIEGLMGIIGELGTSFLPGLGGLGAEERQDVAVRSGIALWWANLKARGANARAAWETERARQARARGAHMVAQDAEAQAAQARANTQGALRAAEQAHTVSQAMSRQDPAMAEAIAETVEALDANGQEASQIDGMLGAAIVGATIVGGDMAMRQANLRANRARVAERKMAELKKAANKTRPGVRRSRMNRRGPRIMAPVQPTSVRDPSNAGRITGTTPENMWQVIQHAGKIQLRQHLMAEQERKLAEMIAERERKMAEMTAREMAAREMVPSSMEGMGSFSLNSPWVWGTAAGLGILFFMNRK